MSGRTARQAVTILLSVLFLSGIVINPVPAASVALTPRVFLPLAQRVWQYEPPAELPFGVSDGSDTRLVDFGESMDLLLAAGVLYNRTSVSWRAMEPTNRTPENYEWTVADGYLNSLLARGFQPFVLVMNNPSWAASTPCGPVYNPEDLAEFVAALAARYPRVRYWALYNEVDNVTYSQGFSTGGCFGEDDVNANGVPDYAEYAEMMRAVWKRMKAANANAQLAFGQLSYDNFTPDSRPSWYPGGCCFNYNFLDNLMRYIAAHPLPAGEQYGDALGFNDYLLYNDVVWQPRYSQVGVGAKAAALRELMARHGQDFPLVISEISGWSSNGPPDGVTQQVQARQLAQMMTQGYFYDIKALIWWTWDDYPDDCVSQQGCHTWKFGIIDQDLAPKPSYYALNTLSQQLRNYVPFNVEHSENLVTFVFRRGELEKRVLYTKSETDMEVTFAAKTLRVTDMFGNVNFYRHNGNQKIKIQVTPDLRYVEINP